jgi:hypothetical protein
LVVEKYRHKKVDGATEDDDYTTVEASFYVCGPRRNTLAAAEADAGILAKALAKIDSSNDVRDCLGGEVDVVKVPSFLEAWSRWSSVQYLVRQFLSVEDLRAVGTTEEFEVVKREINDALDILWRAHRMALRMQDKE